MLIRQGGGRDGIKQYLENGLKSSNTIHRDVLDKRVILEGDLDVTDKIIQSINNVGERYSHYTLSFKEDTISPEILHEVTERFKHFLLHAYHEDEYDFYAEAHLPKIKSYIDKKTGTTIFRKPHIHVVVPKVNLLTGEYLNPLGFYKHNQNFIEAIQETLNIEINLESPKDNKRNYLNDVSEIISRYKGDFFLSNSRRFKEKVLSTIINRNIDNWQDFTAYLLELGDIKIRNENKNNSYINVKLQGEKKGVNLKESFFTKAFIELSRDQKIAAIVNKSKIQTPEEKKIAYLEYQKNLEVWYKRRSHEIKYLNPSSKEYAEYKRLSLEDKQTVIDSKIIVNKSLINSIKDDCFGGYPNYGLLQNMINNSIKGTKNVIYSKQITKIPPTFRRDRLRNLSECGVVGFSKRSEMLLPDNVSYNLGDRDGGGHNNVRWTVYREGIDSAEISSSSFRLADNVAESMLQQLREDRVSSTKFDGLDWKTIQASLDLNIFLESLTNSHGVIRENYSVVKGNDGIDRVKCGHRQFTINDFLTKEMHLSWNAAKKLIETEFEHQSSNFRTQARQPPHSNFWSGFKQWQVLPENSFKHIWQLQRESEKNRRSESNESFAKRKRAIFSVTSSYSDRQAKLSLLRMEKVRTQQSLRSVFAKERIELKDQLTTDEQYLVYLQSLINGGDTYALDELRRFSTHQHTVVNPDYSIKTPRSSTYSALLDSYNFKVKNNGNVIYYINNKKAVEDTREWVAVLEQHDADAIEVALRLAIEKNYHKSVELTGSEEFQRKVIEVSIQRGVSVTFTSVELQALHNKLSDEQSPMRHGTNINIRSKNNLKQ